MIVRQSIDNFVNEIVRVFRPEQVVLFGSYACGQPNEHSDVDLLVVMRHRGAPAEQAARIRQAIRAGFPLDLIVRTPADIRRRLKMGDGFIKEILMKGQILHEAGRA